MLFDAKAVFSRAPARRPLDTGRVKALCFGEATRTSGMTAMRSAPRAFAAITALGLGGLLSCVQPGLHAHSAATPAATVMYASFAPSDPEVFIADGNGANARPVLSTPGYDYNASLSADGK